ncbi:potassium channel subfamily K member 13 [Myripristis murdjan]|uniref:Potassium channel subfamily K member 13-like n=1 Tax=Myripristis murdjan TaxID=586833 RepID=A0A667YHP1_9TELE|nr:potassium channel subfamily K member 13-like [Myripristis murdjan]
MRRASLCCCPSLCLSRDTACFCLLGVLIALYMLAGAAMFSSLEGPAELQAHQLWETRLKDFSHEHRVSCEDVRSLIHHYEEARAAGIRMERGRTLWDFAGAFYFVGTVISTIGFGMTAPSSTLGKVLLVFYGLLGCSATILFFNLYMERVVTFLGFLMRWCHKRRSQHDAWLHTGGECRDNDEHGGKEEWKPSVFQVMLVLLAAVLVVACGAATLYSAMEGWSYLEALYFCFVAFSTVGFGDLVSCQKEHHEDSQGYKVANCLLMLLGVCCMYSLFNIISIVLKMGLGWMLKTSAWAYRNFCHTKPQHMSLFKLCLSDANPPMQLCENEPQRMQKISCLGHNMLTLSSAPNTISRCLCDEAKVETVCHSDTDRLIAVQQVQGNCLLRGSGVNVRPLPL